MIYLCQETTCEVRPHFTDPLESYDTGLTVSFKDMYLVAVLHKQSLVLVCGNNYLHVSNSITNVNWPEFFHEISSRYSDDFTNLLSS